MPQELLRNAKLRIRKQINNNILQNTQSGSGDCSKKRMRHMCNIFDYDAGDYLFPLGDDMAIDSDGDMYLRLSDTMALDMYDGEIHFVSGWDDEDD